MSESECVCGFNDTIKLIITAKLLKFLATANVESHFENFWQKDKMQNFETVVQINEIYRMKNKVETFDSTNSNIPFSVRISCVCAELSDAPLKIMFKQKV